MKRLLFLFVIFLFSCQEAPKEIYPGIQPSWGECRDLWDNGYRDFDVAECEKVTASPRFKLGQKVSIKEYDSTACYGVIITNRRWHKESGYNMKVYCDGKIMHDESCAKNAWMNCPFYWEHDLTEDNK